MTFVMYTYDAIHFICDKSFGIIISEQNKRQTAAAVKQIQRRSKMSQPVVSIDKLVKRYGENVAVDHFSLKIEEGEILGLLGPNGSGKTTTINCLLSLLTYDKGDIKIWGKEMSPSAYDIKSQIGVVMQNVAVIDTLSVYENVDFFCGLYINDKKLRKQYVEEALEFTGLTDYKKQKPKKLKNYLRKLIDGMFLLNFILTSVIMKRLLKQQLCFNGFF